MKREFHARFCEGGGVRFPSATRLVILCRTRCQAGQALARVKEVMGALRLRLHPDKARMVELGLGKDGFDFLGCHLRIVESRFKKRCYLFRWPSVKAMKAIRARIHDVTRRRRWAGMKDIREVIHVLNPVLRGWGNYFKTGNASKQFNQLDTHVWRRLLRLLLLRGSQRKAKRYAKRPFRTADWPHERLVTEHGLYKLRGTIRYPGGSHAT